MIDQQKKEDNSLTLREKLTIAILILIVKVIKPFAWAHEFDKSIAELKELIEKGA